MNRRVLLPLAALLPLGLLAGALWLTRGEGAVAPEEVEAAVGPPASETETERAAAALEPGEPPVLPGPVIREERRVSLGELSLPENLPERPEPGEYEGELVRVTYDDGTPCFEAQQRQDSHGTWLLNGRWTSWHENGQVQEQGWYEDQREVGDWQWWDDNGQRIAAGQFVDGKREGDWAFWYSNGVRQIDAHYSDGLGTGYWTLYFDDGQKCAEGAFDGGEITGFWTIWDEFGAVNPERTGFYEHGVRVSD